MTRLARALTALAGAALLAVAGCSSTSAPQSAATPTGTLTVFAAASLTEAFGTLGTRFESAHPGVRVVTNFGPSSGLAQQIIQGAPADVFASASPKNMMQVVSAGEVTSPATFATNVMEIAVPPDNPARMTTVADLARPGVKVALCQPQVPCGATAQQVFTNAMITVRPVTEEVDVKSVLSKVELGEVDAGLVYVTDVRAAGAKVRGIGIPGGLNAATAYPIAALTRSTNPRLARAFVDYVRSAAGASVLSADGFARP